MRYIAIVLAGGRGSRMKSDIPKQYMELGGKQVLYYSLERFQKSNVSKIILVTGRGDEDYCRKQYIDMYGFDKIEHIVAGGSERYYSVLNGLRSIAESDEETYVMIHDGARPCISDEVIERCMQEVSCEKACVAAVPVKDTIKIADGDGYAESTPDRNYLWQIQTPQCFEYHLIKDSYERMAADENRGNITDDAMVVEKYSDSRIKLTMGSYENIKITTPEDIQTALGFMKLQ